VSHEQEDLLLESVEKVRNVRRQVTAEKASLCVVFGGDVRMCCCVTKWFTMHLHGEKHGH